MIAFDTNIYAYTLDEDSLVKRQRSVDLILSLPDDIRQRPVLWQVACEFLAFLRRQQNKKRIDPVDIRREMRAVLTGCRLVLPAPDVLDAAIQLQTRYSLSHWDSLLLAACLHAGIDTLYSEDMSHGMTYDTVTVINPFKNP